MAPQQADFPFQLAPMVWKLLVKQPVLVEDILGVDSDAGTILRKVAAMGPGDKPLQCFEITNSTGDIVELVPGGSSKEVSYDVRDQFLDLAMQLRSHEFDRQVAAMRKGFAMVVPVQVLQLGSWEEVMVRVCGVPDVDIELLQANTNY